MERNAEVLRELLAETLNRLDRSNVGKSGEGKGQGQQVGKAGMKRPLAQHLN